MVLRKPKANLSSANGGGFQNIKGATNGVGSRMKISEPIDHWDFLEEIEAPMWVDLTSETKSVDLDIHDAWFQVAHPFHLCSSHELMCASSLSKGNRNSNSELLGSYSPMLPASVSRSRGKDYRSRKWKESNNAVSLNKKHPIGNLGQKMFQMVKGSVQETDIEYKFGTQKGTVTKKKSLICPISSSSSMRSYSTTMSTSRDTKSSLVVKSSVTGESNSTRTSVYSNGSSNFGMSTLTENNQQPSHDTSERLHQTSGLTNGFFLGERRIRLTRTGVTRQPSRVEIKHSNGNVSSSSNPSGNHGKQLNGRNSSSSNSSSVGSSMNPRFDLKDTSLSAVLNIYTTPESRKIIGFGQVAKYPKQKASYVSKTSGIQNADLTSSSQLGVKALDRKSTNQSSRVLCQTEPTNALQLGKVQESSNMKAVEMAGTRRSNRVGGSNADARGSKVLGQISSGKENATGGIPGQKPIRQTMKEKNVMALSDMKLGKIQESSNVRIKDKEMAGTRRSNRVAGTRNVNARVVLGQIPSGKENDTGGIPGRKPSNQMAKVKSVMESCHIKPKTKSGYKSNMDAAQRIHFR